MSEREMGGRRVFVRWVLATWAGWVLGIPIIAALALAGEAVGIGGVQVLVGLGMGAGIGLMQGRIMRGVLRGFAPWFWSCVVGLGLAYLAVDVAKLAQRDFPYYPYSSVALGGLIVGVWQAFLLRTHFRKAGYWIAGSLLGWVMAAGLVGVADALFRSRSIRGAVGVVAYLASLIGGGLILGLVTGISLVWVLRHKSPAIKTHL